MTATPQAALDELLATPLFEADFPKRRRASVQDLAGFSEDEIYALGAPQEAAIYRYRHGRSAELIRSLGEARYGPALPALLMLWRESAHQPSWAASGHALFAFGAGEAWDALEEGLEDSASLARFLAIKTIIAREPDGAYDRLADRLLQDAEPHVPSSLLQAFSLLPDAKALLERDPRWLALFSRQRGHKRYGFMVRDILRDVPPAHREPHLARAMAEEAAQTPPPLRTRRDGALLGRYRMGEHEAVWREIRAWPRIDGACREEVLEIADVAMARVAGNAALLGERLAARGWRPLAFVEDEDAAFLTTPSPEDDAIIARIAETAGSPIPPTLLSFWRVVGGVNLIWNYQSEPPDVPFLGVKLAMDTMDPLCVHEPRLLLAELDEWDAMAAEVEPGLEEPFRIPLAPDVYHKANYSGGGPYEVWLPFEGADPILEDEPHGLPFLDYLRLAFRWAGFPGLEKHAHREDVRRFVAEFGADLAPF